MDNIITDPPNLNADLVQNETKKGQSSNPPINQDAKNDQNSTEQSDGHVSVPKSTEKIASQEDLVQNEPEKGPSCSRTINQGLENDQDSATMQSAWRDVLDPKSIDYQIIRYLTHPNYVKYQKQVASLLHLHKSTISRKIKAFLQKGYIFKINKGKEGKINTYRANPDLFPEIALPFKESSKIKTHNFFVRLDVMESSLPALQKLRKTLPMTKGWDRNAMHWELMEIPDEMLGHLGWKRFKNPNFRIFVTPKSFFFYPNGFGNTAKEAERDARNRAIEIRDLLEQNYKLMLDFSFGDNHQGGEHHFTIDSSDPDTVEGPGRKGGTVIEDIRDTTYYKVPRLELDFQKFRSDNETKFERIDEKLSVVISSQEKLADAVVKMSENMNQFARGFETFHDQRNHENAETKIDENMRNIPQSMYL